MKKHHSYLCFAAVAICVFGCAVRPTFAQTVAPPPSKTEVIHLHDIRPDMMAYWIDPAHQPVPPEYQYYTRLPGHSEAQINQYIPQIKAFEGSFHGQITAVIDAQNALMISASQGDLDKDKKLIGDMDQPLQQVDVKGIILSGNSKILKTIPTSPLHLLSAKNNDAPYSIALMTDDADALIKQLRSSGKLKLAHNIGGQAMNSYPLVAGWSVATPIELEIKQTPGLYLPFTSIGGRQIGLETDPTMTAIPTINADDTVTLSLTLSFDASLVDNRALDSRPPFSEKQPGRIFIKSLNGGPVTFKFTLKDNQSVLITGIDHLLTMGDFHPPAEILILTAHVLHRSNQLGDR
jgi:hypothetical protein